MKVVARLPGSMLEVVGSNVVVTWKFVLESLTLFETELITGIPELIMDGIDELGLPVRVRSVDRDLKDCVLIPVVAAVDGNVCGGPRTLDPDGRDDAITVQVVKPGISELVEIIELSIEGTDSDLGGAVVGGVTVIVIVLDTKELIWVGGEIPPNHCVVPSTTE